ISLTPIRSLFPSTTLFRSRRPFVMIIRCDGYAVWKIESSSRYDFLPGRDVLCADRNDSFKVVEDRTGRNDFRLDFMRMVFLHRRSEEHTSELQSLAYLVCR